MTLLEAALELAAEGFELYPANLDKLPYSGVDELKLQPMLNKSSVGGQPIHLLRLDTK